MLQIIFLFFGILAMIYLIISESINNNNNNNKNIISTPNIYPINIQSINPIKKQILWKNNKNRKQKRKI
jgi:hypothetical protein